MILRDTDDDVPGHVAPFTTQGDHRRTRRIKTTTPKGHSLNTIACEGIARLRAQEWLDAGDANGALPFLRHANEHMTRNNVMRAAAVRR
ncbi:MAG: hypothetical protein E6Q97_21870 [Desulfurellales bacterium]|nr:MAG: hypothetical protein E6Q97_21870 [Desulfurellales bacterium]